MQNKDKVIYYFDMKDHHHHLNHWCMQDYNGTVPTDIRELYTEYIQIGQRMRVKLLRKALADSGPHIRTLRGFITDITNYEVGPYVRIRKA